MSRLAAACRLALDVCGVLVMLLLFGLPWEDGLRAAQYGNSPSTMVRQPLILHWSLDLLDQASPTTGPTYALHNRFAALDASWCNHPLDRRLSVVNAIHIKEAKSIAYEPGKR